MLPEQFLTRMEQQLGAEFPEYLQSLRRPRAVALRFNPQKGELPRLPFLREPVPWEPTGYYYDPQARPGLHGYHEAGVYYLQEASAMAPAALLDPQPGERILDLCAAPGGKSTQIAGRMQGKGLLVSNEISPKRAKVLSQNIERMGIANAVVTSESPAALAERFPEFFHRVMVDAPCSGEGMFRKEEAAVTDWSPETVAMCADRQKEILRSAAAMLRPGGFLCYSTCTFAPEEDEGVMAWFLKEYPDFAPVAVEAPWFAPARPEWADSPDRRIARGFRLWPHLLGGEGHFVMLLQRAGDASAPPSPPPSSISMPKELTDFLQALDITLPAGELLSFGPSLYLAPMGTPKLEGLKVLRPGLELGTLKKGRFEPAHALALWLDTCRSTADFPADSQEVLDYLHGQVLPGAQVGWTLITVDGHSLGWAKGSGGQLKNHFPKGLRWV